MVNMNIHILAALLVLCGFAFADPMLQISNYTLIPSTLYPGTYGYAQLTLNNVGDATAESVDLHYDYNVSGESTLSVGDIASDSSAMVLVPFQIRQEGGTIQVMSVDAYYVSSTGTDHSSRKSSITIPLVISEYSPLEVSTVSTDPGAIASGEGITSNLAVTNDAGVVDNLIISMPDNSSFSIDGMSQKNVGGIPSNSTVNVSLRLLSSSDAKVGTYSIPVLFSFQDASNEPHNQTIMVGPISVLDSSMQYQLSLEPEEAVEIGSDVAFNMTIRNSGSSPISGVVDINSTSVFTPIGMQTVYFDSVPAGSSVSKEVHLGVASSASSGFYTLPLTMTTSNGNPIVFDAGITVSATPQITVSLDSSSGTPEVTVANTGNSQIRSVYVSVTPQGSQSSTQSFIGTLNVDDSATVALNSETSSVAVTIRFRDSNNQEQTITKTLESTSENSSFVGGGGSNNAQDPPSVNASQGMGGPGGSPNPLGMLMGPGGGTSLRA